MTDRSWTMTRSSTGTMHSLRRVPRRRSSFLTSFDGTSLLWNCNECVSESWPGSTHKPTLHITAAVGSIDVEWVD